MKYGILLPISHTFEVVRLDAMLAEHGHLGGLVFTEEIVGCNHIALLFLSGNVSLSDGIDLLSLLRRELEIDSLILSLVCLQLDGVLLLSFLQHAGVADGHLTVDSVGGLQGLRFRRLLGNLSIAPLLLLHVLHSPPVAEAYIGVSFQIILTLVFAVKDAHAGDLFTSRRVDSCLE